MGVHAFTSCSYSYLNRARVLAKTLRLYHPDWVLWIVMTDKEPPGFTFDLAEEDFDYILSAEDLYGDATNKWLFGHDIVEACTAVKGRASVRILQRDDCDKLVYFDPDIALFNPVDPVIDLLDEYDIILTPHQIDPVPGEDKVAVRDNEITSLGYGVYNLGFLALAGAEGLRMAQWWEERLNDWCHDKLDMGIFVDQKWCDLVPCLFDKVKILRDPGYNLASWNLSCRQMHFTEDGRALINDVPLRFYHFTKLGPVGDVMTQRYASDNIEIYELWWWYRQQVMRASSSSIPKGWWFYGTFADGTKIPKSARELYRDRMDLRAAFESPFESGSGSYHEWLGAQTSLLDPGAAQSGFVPV